MRPTVTLITSVLFCSSLCLAQPWEIGGDVGFGWYRGATVTNATGQAKVSFDPRIAWGVVIADDHYNYIAGEVRYTYRDGDLQLKSGSLTAAKEGRSHAIAYDFLFHAKPKGSRIRPFVAGGGGVKVYQGTGRETVTQLLSNYALLTKTDQWEPLISFGGGVKCELSSHAQFRADFRDYVTPTPEKLFTPVTGAKLKGWLHDFVPMVGVSYVF